MKNILKQNDASRTAFAFVAYIKRKLRRWWWRRRRRWRWRRATYYRMKNKNCFMHRKKWAAHASETTHTHKIENEMGETERIGWKAARKKSREKRNYSLYCLIHRPRRRRRRRPTPQSDWTEPKKRMNNSFQKICSNKYIFLRNKKKIT